MKKNPLVSIIIPVYNGANFLSEAIDSALSQTYKNIEIIVVNDGSKDNTEEIALSYGDKIFYYSKSNGGVSSALNLGIERMKGDYFSWLSHDDLYAPRKIEKEVELLAKYESEILIASCGTSLIDEKGKPVMSARDCKLVGYVDSKKMFSNMFSDEASLGGCSFLIPKKVFDEVGGFKPLKYTQDVECWGRMMISGFNYVVVSDNLVFSRVHSNQTTNQYPELYYQERSIYCNYLVDYIIEKKGPESSLLLLLLKFCYQRNNEKSIEYIEQYVNLNIFQKTYYKIKGKSLNALRDIYHKYVKKRNLNK